MTDTHTHEIIEAVRLLPPDKIAELRDFAFFLRDRYSKPEVIDESDEWSDEDYKDFSAASFAYFEQSEQARDDYE